MSARVVVLGAGVAGLTVAHELVNRGFDVTVYEARGAAGGKSRSYPVRLLDPRDGNPVSGFDGVPGEHGFRFFPGFYRHLDDTMQQVPAAETFRTGDRKTTLDCLIDIREELLAVGGHRPIEVPASIPLTVKTIRNVLRLPAMLGDSGLTDADLATFSDKLWQIATSCAERRNEEYEKVGWRDFVDSKSRSDEYYWYLASGLTRALVAARARYASTKTMGNVALRLFDVAFNVGQTTDRVLCGPTNDVWIDPWVKYIAATDAYRAGRRKGAGTIEYGTLVKRLGVDDGRVDHVVVHKVGREDVTVRADYFVSALPVEALTDLIKHSPALQKDQEFRNVVAIASAKGDQQCLRRMSGLQIYCREQLRLGARPLNKGHQLLLDSPWGLTSISQSQFWDRMPYGVGDILSIDISSWDMKGMGINKTAFECEPFEVFNEVCTQVAAGLGKGLLNNDNIIGWHLDESPELLLVNRVDSWRLRPTASTPFRNLKLAGDFAQTRTDLACMEGANESARIAVNEILSQENWPTEEHCPVWAAHEPMLLQPLQEMDRYRYERGLPWSGGVNVGQWLVGGAHTAAVAADPLRPLEPSPSKTGARTNRLPRSEWDDAPKEMPVVALTRKQIEDNLKSFDRYAQPGRSDTMFNRWRLYKRKEDPKYLVPLHIYDADILIIYGRARNFAHLEKETEGTGYFPVSCDVGGDRIGFAELWIVRYNDTSVGPCKEIAINFVVSKDENKPRYRWRTPYSALVPMMDPSNRLFTPILILEETFAPGCIEYGNKLFGMNKLRGRVNIEPGAQYKFSCRQVEERAEDGTIEPCREELSLSGEVDVRTTRLDSAAAVIEVARELGPIAAARNWQQIRAGMEIGGGLVTKDFREQDGSVTGVPAVEIRAAYKFAPDICRLNAGARLEFGPSQFGRNLEAMRFEAIIAAHEPHLKSVLYTNDYPTPED